MKPVEKNSTQGKDSQKEARPATKKTTPKKQSPQKNNADIVKQWTAIRGDLNAAETQFVSRVLYREGYRVMTMVVMVLSALLFFYIVFDKTTEVEARNIYFAQKPDGTLTDLKPLSQPNLSPSAIVNWATNAVPKIYSFDFKNLEFQLDAAGKEFFTTDGYMAFANALNTGSPSVLSAVKDSRYVVTTTLAGKQAVIEKHGSFGELYAWQVAVPVLITYANSIEEKTNSKLIRLTIVRTPEIEKTAGIAISKFVMMDM